MKTLKFDIQSNPFRLSERSMVMMRELPKEIVEEILCRVPATHLKRLRPTCKWWYRLFNDKRFARKDSKKAQKQFLAFVLKSDHIVRSWNINLQGTTLDIKRKFCRFNPHADNSPLKFDVSPFDRVFHCDGLLLCTSVYKEPRILVWNPLTGQTRWIETGDTKEDHMFVLGYYYQGNTKSYKILRLKCGVKGSEVYEFDSGSWRICLDDMAPHWDTQYSTQVVSHAVSLKGKAYLFARDKTGVSLLSFDFCTEKFVPVLLPYQCDNYKIAAVSVFREEKLSVILHREDAYDTEVWVTNKIDETQVVSWTKVLALKLSSHIQVSSDDIVSTSFLLYEEKKVVVWFQKLLFWNEELHTYAESTENVIENIIYIVGEDNIVQEEDWGDDAESKYCCPAIFNYVPSLAQIEL